MVCECLFDMVSKISSSASGDTDGIELISTTKKQEEEEEEKVSSSSSSSSLYNKSNKSAYEII